MKNLLQICIFILILGISVLAQDRLSTITVKGTAEIYVAPDEVIFSLDATNLDKDLLTAKRQNDETVRKVLDLSKRFSVMVQDIKTDFISVQKEYEYVKDKDNKLFDEDGDEISRKVFKGYEISKTIIIKLKDIAKFEEFFSEVLKSGITKVKNVNFETSKLRKLKDEARELAMKAAQEKATAMAGAIGQAIGKAVSVTEGDNINRGYSTRIDSNITTEVFDALPSGTSFSELLAGKAFAPGAIKVEATVTVSFILR
jgi:uncharacterized protein YggE